eukprot:1163094-Rhodomonas_salina.5
MSGTDVGCASEDRWLLSTGGSDCSILQARSLFPYALARQCPVLIQRARVPSCSGHTGGRSGSGITRCSPDAMSRTSILHAPIMCLCSPYTMSRTDTLCAANNQVVAAVRLECLVLTSAIPLPGSVQTVESQRPPRYTLLAADARMRLCTVLILLVLPGDCKPVPGESARDPRVRGPHYGQKPRSSTGCAGRPHYLTRPPIRTL